MSLTLRVAINTADASRLRTAGYKLCLAKRVNDTFNVIWKSGVFLNVNNFYWDPEYRVFGTKTSNGEGAIVQADREPVEIRPGQIAVLDPDGYMHAAVGAAHADPGVFYVENQSKGIRVGVQQRLNGSYATVYVAPEEPVNGQLAFMAVNEVLVFFGQADSTGSIISDSISNCILVDYPNGLTSRGVAYVADPDNLSRGVWTLDGQLALCRTYDVRSNTFTVDRPTKALLSTAADILSAPHRSMAISVKAIAGFEPSAARKFAAYLRAARPSWDVTRRNSTVEICLQPGDGPFGTPEAVHHCEKAFLKAYDSFDGQPYKRLIFSVSGQLRYRSERNSTNVSASLLEDPTPSSVVNAAAPESSGKAVFRFGNIPDPVQFARDTATWSTASVTMSAVARGVAAIVTVQAAEPSANPAADREKVVRRLMERVQDWKHSGNSWSLIYEGPIIWSA
ncbi:hypothetical protein BV20DRAFT_937644 [Pilatotrama ljubarskyi]|nr:hypothetical protein BV20DRAFT_937644 [Pilatotrama ljubarskyi]